MVAIVNVNLTSTVHVIGTGKNEILQASSPTPTVLNSHNIIFTPFAFTHKKEKHLSASVTQHTISKLCNSQHPASCHHPHPHHHPHCGSKSTHSFQTHSFQFSQCLSNSIFKIQSPFRSPVITILAPFTTMLSHFCIFLAYQSTIALSTYSVGYAWSQAR
jgi:hypothetical protein